MPDYIYLLTSERWQNYDPVINIGPSRNLEETEKFFTKQNPEPCYYFGYFELLQDSCFKIDKKLRTKWLTNHQYDRDWNPNFYSYTNHQWMIMILTNLFQKHQISFIYHSVDPPIIEPMTWKHLYPNFKPLTLNNPGVLELPVFQIPSL